MITILNADSSLYSYNESDKKLSSLLDSLIYLAEAIEISYNRLEKSLVEYSCNEDAQNRKLRTVATVDAWSIVRDIYRFNKHYRRLSKFDVINPLPEIPPELNIKDISYLRNLSDHSEARNDKMASGAGSLHLVIYWVCCIDVASDKYKSFCFTNSNFQYDKTNLIVGSDCKSHDLDFPIDSCTVSLRGTKVNIPQTLHALKNLCSALENSLLHVCDTCTPKVKIFGIG